MVGHKWSNWSLALLGATWKQVLNIEKKRNSVQNPSMTAELQVWFQNHALQVHWCPWGFWYNKWFLTFESHLFHLLKKLLNSYIPCDILNIQFHFICIVLLGYFCKVTQDDTWHEDLIQTKEPASLLYTGTVCHPTAHLRTEQCTGCQRPHITWS